MKFLFYIDRILFKDFFWNNYKKYVIKKIEDNYQNNFSIYYESNHHYEINKLCEKHKTDKGYLNTDKKRPFKWIPHTYADFYNYQYRNRKKIKNVFELGIGTPNTMGKKYRAGASLRMWKDYFYSANIYGADISREYLFEESRIKTFYCDQANKVSIKKMWNKIKKTQFDIIIDDGLHFYKNNICFFESSFHKLTDHGEFIIEDVSIFDFQKYFRKYFKKRKIKYYFISLYSNDKIHSDNNLILIKKIENKKI
jgi:hypothetical protein